MVDQPTPGSLHVAGPVSGQGIAIGHQASAVVKGSSFAGDGTINATQLRETLEQLYDALGETGLPRDQVRKAQTAAGNALDGVSDDEVQADTVVQQVQKVAETLKEANVVVERGSSLWESVQKLAPLLGPLVGGARLVSAWFGIPL
jgi:hypothetical protein